MQRVVGNAKSLSHALSLTEQINTYDFLAKICLVYVMVPVDFICIRFCFFDL